MNRRIRAGLLVVAAVMLSVMLGACQKKGKTADGTVKEGTLIVGMECAYAPYNWAQEDDSNGAVKINGSSQYAYGYDVMMAKYIAEKLGLKLEIVQKEWEGLPLGVQSGELDCVIAGQSITAERLETVDFTTPYYYATIVTLVRADSPYANAKCLADLKGAKAVSQISTIWYEKCLPQIPEVQKLTALATAPEMIVALTSGAADVVVTDQPTALSAVSSYPELKLLDFAGSGNDYEVSDEDINIGISLQKGNKVLQDKINAVLADLTKKDFEDWMKKAISLHVEE